MIISEYAKLKFVRGSNFQATESESYMVESEEGYLRHEVSLNGFYQLLLGWVGDRVDLEEMMTASID